MVSPRSSSRSPGHALPRVALFAGLSWFGCWRDASAQELPGKAPPAHVEPVALEVPLPSAAPELPLARCALRREADAASRREDLSPEEVREAYANARASCPATILVTCPAGVTLTQDDQPLPCGVPTEVEAGRVLDLVALEGDHKLARTRVLLPGSETTTLRIERTDEDDAEWVLTSAPLRDYDSTKLETDTGMGIFMLASGVVLTSLGTALIVEGVQGKPGNRDEELRNIQALSYGWMGALGGLASMGAGVLLLSEPGPPRLALPRTSGLRAPASPGNQVWAGAHAGTSWGATAGLSW